MYLPNQSVDGHELVLAINLVHCAHLAVEPFEHALQALGHVLSVLHLEVARRLSVRQEGLRRHLLGVVALEVLQVENVLVLQELVEDLEVELHLVEGAVDVFALGLLIADGLDGALVQPDEEVPQMDFRLVALHLESREHLDGLPDDSL